MIFDRDIPLVAERFRVDWSEDIMVEFTIKCSIKNRTGVKIQVFVLSNEQAEEQISHRIQEMATQTNQAYQGFLAYAIERLDPISEKLNTEFVDMGCYADPASVKRVLAGIIRKGLDTQNGLRLYRADRRG